MLSDRDIYSAIGTGELDIDPLINENMQPASIDLTLGHEFRLFNKNVGVMYPTMDVKNWKDYTYSVEVDDKITIFPGEFFLGSTAERIKLSDTLAARMDGKSSLARIGLMVHATAGFVDPGFEGVLVMEFSNVGSYPLALYPGMSIAQLSFNRLDTASDLMYGGSDLNSKYQNQDGPVGSRYHLNYT